jgi:hypothetical protein
MTLAEFESQYMELFWRLQRSQWENYADDAKNDLSSIDQELYSLVASRSDEVDGGGRKEQILRAICAINWTREITTRTESSLCATRILRASACSWRGE